MQLTKKLKKILEIFKNYVPGYSYSKYDKDGNLMYHIDYEGNEVWYAKGATHCKDANGFEQWWKYDSEGREIHYINSYGVERQLEYDKMGNLIYTKHITDLLHIYEQWWEYNEDNKLVGYKNTSGHEERYDENKNTIYYKDSDGEEEWREFDSSGREIYFENNKGIERYTSYDSDGNATIHTFDKKSLEEFKNDIEIKEPIN